MDDKFATPRFLGMSITSNEPVGGSAGNTREVKKKLLAENRKIKRPAPLKESVILKRKASSRKKSKGKDTITKSESALTKKMKSEIKFDIDFGDMLFKTKKVETKEIVDEPKAKKTRKKRKASKNDSVTASVTKKRKSRAKKGTTATKKSKT